MKKVILLLMAITAWLAALTAQNPTSTIAAPGLDGNPASTGQIFSDTAPYIRRAGEGTESLSRKINRNETAKQGRLKNRERRVTCNISGVEHELDFNSFRYRHGGKNEKIDICQHFTSSMFGNDSFWLKNEILLDPQHYFDKSRLIATSDVDTHNTGAATIALKNATDKFFYYETPLANGKKITLHCGRYRESQKIYLYAASETLPDYVQNPQ